MHVASRSVTPPPSVPKSAPHPATANGSGLFWVANDSFSTVSFLNNSCSVYSYTGYFDSDCYNQAVSPTLMNLSDGNVGISFSIYTNRSATTCGGSYTNMRERVAYAVSTNGGESFGKYVNIGNDTCTYLDAIEPSFAVAPNGTIYGVFVEENYSDNQGDCTSRTTGSGCVPDHYYYYYYYRCYYGDGNDALGLVESTNNGTSFTKPITILSGGNISKPQLVIDGQSLYVLFENDSNGTTALDYGQYGYTTGDPISEQLLFSSDSGATWTGPLTLPGENSAANYTTLGGAIAVNAAGLLGAAYFTNHRCVANVSFYTCWDSGDDLVYTTSSTNGSTWAPLATVQTNVGESYDWDDSFYMDAFFQVVPQAALYFDSAGANAYITWSGTYNNSLLTSAPYNVYDTWDTSGIFAAVGPVSGASFTVSSIQVATLYSDRDSSFNPSIAETSGTIYVVVHDRQRDVLQQLRQPARGLLHRELADEHGRRSELVEPDDPELLGRLLLYLLHDGLRGLLVPRLQLEHRLHRLSSAGRRLRSPLRLPGRLLLLRRHVRLQLQLLDAPVRRLGLVRADGRGELHGERHRRRERVELYRERQQLLDDPVVVRGDEHPREHARQHRARDRAADAVGRHLDPRPQRRELDRVRPERDDLHQLHLELPADALGRAD